MTLAELIVAAALTGMATGAALLATTPLQREFAAHPEAAALTQRTRVVAELLASDVRRASLVLPYREGDVDSDSARGVFYRPDVLTTIADPLAAIASGLITPSQMRTYHLKQDSEGVWQLMQYDGHASDQPAVEDVISLRMDYFGAAAPPIATMTEDGEVRVTYGPSPPPPATDDPDDSWGPGENCIIALAGGVHLPRLATLGASAVVPLPFTMFSDGPWCPDASHPFRFDADLLRVRRIRLAVRLQAAQPFRGMAGGLFTNRGAAGDPSRFVPDETFTIDVSPRNIDVAR